MAKFTVTRTVYDANGERIYADTYSAGSKVAAKRKENAKRNTDCAELNMGRTISYVTNEIS